MIDTTSAERRFGGVIRLFGHAGYQRLANAAVAVVGLGGVGSWAVEALARSGVGELLLIDLDHVAESNINRQLHALDATLGASKAEVMRARVAQINPSCRVALIDDFVSEQNVAELIGSSVHAVIDAIDQVAAKAALIALARGRGQPIIVCGGAGGRTDSLALARADLAHTTGDPLLAAVRARLRRHYGFAPAAAKPNRAAGAFGVTAIYSTEPLAGGAAALAGIDDAVASAPVDSDAAPMVSGGAPLSCSGYGSLASVTAAIGMAAAGDLINRLARADDGDRRASDESIG